MLKGDIVVVDFDKDFPFVIYTLLDETLLKFCSNKIYQNLWTIESSIHTGYWLRHNKTGNILYIPREFVIGIDVIRDKKINDLLC